MRVLFLGEYSGFYNNLAEGFKAKGHEVVLINDGDNFKNYHRDIDIGSKVKNKAINHLHKIYRQLTNFRKISGYDIVYIINPLVFSRFIPSKFLIKYIIANNKKIIYTVASDDSYYWIGFRNGIFPYGPHKGSLSDDKINRSIWESKRCVGLTFFLVNHPKVNTVINGVDYYIAYKSFGLIKPFIPLPFPAKSSLYLVENNDLIDHSVDTRIRIFHGVQPHRSGFKGSNFFDDAMKIILSKYSQHIIYTRVTNVPFADYQKMLINSDIVLDQANSHGPGMNALQAMSMGKVVLSGFEQEQMDLMKVEVPPLINIKPNVNDIVEKIEFLINNPSYRNQISKYAVEYINEKHNIKSIVQSYLDL